MMASTSSGVSGTSGCVDGGVGGGGPDASVIGNAGDAGLTFSDTMAMTTADGWLTADDGASILGIDLRRILRLAVR